MKRGYYRDPRLGGGRFRNMIERAVVEGRARVVWSPETGWTNDYVTERDALDRWADDGGACA